MKKSFVLLHLSIVLAGFTGIFGKLISLNEISLVWFRVYFSCVLLYLFLKLTRRFKPAGLGVALRLTSSGMLPGLHWLFFYGSIKYANVSVGVVCFCLTSFFTALLSPLIQRKRLDLTELLISAITLAGVGLIFHFDVSYRTGILLGVISSVFGACYTMTNEKLVKKYDTAMINYYQLLGSSIGVGIILLVYIRISPAQHLIPTGRDIFYLLLLSVFCTIGLYLIVAEVLKKISAFTVNVSFNLEPVYSILLAMLIFRENKVLNGTFYLGLSLIIVSVALQMARSYLSVSSPKKL